VNKETALASAWDAHMARREKATFAVTTLLIAVLMPLWSVFDFYLEPPLAHPFLVFRLADVAITLALWILISRSPRPRVYRSAMLVSAACVGLAIAAMLPQVHHYVLYVLGFSLVFWGCGLILLWPTVYLVTTFAIILATHVAVCLLLPQHASAQDVYGSLFYLLSVSVIATAQLVVRRRLEYEAFSASFSLEERNQDLARSVVALKATQGQLATSSALLADSLDADAVARHVASVLVPAVGESCVLVARGPRGAMTTRVADVDERRKQSLIERIANVPAETIAFARAGEHGEATQERITRLAGVALPEIESVRWLLTTPLIAHGQPTGVVAVGRSDRDFEEHEMVFVEEIARRAALALENARLYRESEDAVRLREDLISMASHELRTPLNTQVLTIERMLATTPSQDANRPMLARLERQVARLSDQVTQLLDASQLAAGKLVLHYEELDLVVLVRSVVDKLSDVAEHAGSQIRITAPASLLGEWDETRLEQVVSNLVVNGIKYGRGKPLDIAVERAATHAIVTVTDRGIGIAESDRGRIFQRYERASADRAVGFGVGLWLARTFVEAMRGTIHVDSEVGRGSTFSVEVPLGRSS